MDFPASHLRNCRRIAGQGEHFRIEKNLHLEGYNYIWYYIYIHIIIYIYYKISIYDHFDSDNLNLTKKKYVMGKASCTLCMTFSSECKYFGNSWQPTMSLCPRLLFWLIVSTRVEYWMFPQSSYMLLFQDPSKSCHIERAQVRQQPNTMYDLVI